MSTYKQLFTLLSLLAISLLSACGQSVPDLPDSAQISQAATAVAATAEAVVANAAASQLAEELPSSEEIAGRFASSIPAGNTPINITITDAQLNEQIAAQQTAVQEQANINNLAARFSGGNVILSGSLTQPINGDIIITFRPYLVGNTIQFEVISATFGNMSVPAVGLSVVQSTLNDTLVGTLNNLPADITIQELSVGDGVMTVVGNIVR